MIPEIAEFDVDDWWSVVESSLKGSFLTAHAALPHLVASKGYLILVSSIGAQLRVSGGSAYNIGKHSLNRLAEWIDIGESCLFSRRQPTFRYSHNFS